MLANAIRGFTYRYIITQPHALLQSHINVVYVCAHTGFSASRYRSITMNGTTPTTTAMTPTTTTSATLTSLQQQQQQQQRTLSACSVSVHLTPPHLTPISPPHLTPISPPSPPYLTIRYISAAKTHLLITRSNSRH